jgi:hypothetical protein
VDFVDDVDLLAQDRRLVTHGLGELAYRVDAAVARAVHLLIVDRAAVADALARVARTAGLHRLARLASWRASYRKTQTVERLTDDACERGLAAASRPAEQKCVMHSSGRERVAERTRHVLLTDDFGKRRRPVFASKDQIRHAARPGLYPVGLRSQRQGLADLLGLHQDFVAEIS